MLIKTHKVWSKLEDFYQNPKAKIILQKKR